MNFKEIKMDFREIAGGMELMAQVLFNKLHAAFIEDLADEEFVMEFLSHIAAEPEKYAAVLDPKVTRLALAYNSAMNSFLEIDELVHLESPADPEDLSDEPETVPLDSENRGKILDFPATTEEDDDE